MTDATLETPILDLQSPLATHRQLPEFIWWQFLLAMTAIIVLPLVAIYFAFSNVNHPAFRLADKFNEADLRPLVDSLFLYGVPFVILSLLSILLITIAVHELGHVAMGSLVNFHLHQISIGPLLFMKVTGRPKLQLQWGDAGGGWVSIGVTSLRQLRRRLTIFASGGILANALSAGLALLVLKHANIAPWLKAELLCFAFVSCALIILNMFPVKARFGRVSDGAIVHMLYSDRRKARRLMAIIALAMQQEMGVKPRDKKSTWIKAATYVNDKSYDALQGFWQAYFWANDREDCSRAGIYLENLLQLAGDVPVSFREMLIAEAANFQAWFRHHPAKAQSWFERIPTRSTLPPLVRIRAGISLHWVHNRQAEAIAAWNDGLKIINERPEPARKRGVDSWNEWKEQLETRRPPFGETPASQSANHDLA